MIDVFNSTTLDAVKLFQKQACIQVDGLVGPETTSALAMSITDSPYTPRVRGIAEPIPCRCGEVSDHQWFMRMDHHVGRVCGVAAVRNFSGQQRYRCLLRRPVFGEYQRVRRTPASSTRMRCCESRNTVVHRARGVPWAPGLHVQSGPHGANNQPDAPRRHSTIDTDLDRCPANGDQGITPVPNNLTACSNTRFSS